MKILTLFALLFSSTCLLHGQVLSVNVGNSINRSKTIRPIVDQLNDFVNHDGYYFIRYHQHILSRKYYVGADISLSEEWNTFLFDGESWFGYGSRAIRSIRIGLYGGYNLFHRNKRFALSPYFSLQLEKTEATSSAGYSPTFSGPLASDGRIVRGRGFYTPIARSSIIPAVGFDVDWNFWWRFHLKFNLFYSYGYQRNSILTFDYTIDGVAQPQAKWETNGTSFYVSVGFGFRLWNPKEKEAVETDPRKKKRKRRKRRH